MSIARFALVLSAVLIAVLPAEGQENQADSFIVRDVRIFDGERTTERRSVVVRGGVIERIGGADLGGEGLREVDGQGHTLLPGLIDSHVHLPGFSPAAALVQSAALGVTTVVDMFSSGETLTAIRAAKEQDAPGMASVILSGTGATAAGGHPSQFTSTPFPTIDGADRAPGFVRDRLSEGSDFLKIIYADQALYGSSMPMIDQETLSALIEAAHAQGVLAIAHIGSEANAREAIAAGIDGLAHIFMAGSVSSDFGEFASEHGVFVIPTLSVLHSSCGMPDAPTLLEDARLRRFTAPPWREGAMRRILSDGSCAALEPVIRQLVEANVPILVGTDAASPGTAYGASVHGEIEAMVRYGMTPAQALMAATSSPARAFSLNDRGIIEAGRRADLLLVQGNPVRDIQNLRNIVQVWKRGIPVTRTQFD